MLAYQAIEIGETMPAVMDAAKEIEVNAFLEGSLKFAEIPLFLQRVMGDIEGRLLGQRVVEGQIRKG